MNQDLAQIMTNTDALVNSLQVDPTKANNSQVDEIKRLRSEMESKIQTYNSTIAKANEDVRKELDSLSRQIQQRVNYLMQPQQ